MIPNGPIVNHHYTITADINLPIEPVAFVLAVLLWVWHSWVGERVDQCARGCIF